MYSIIINMIFKKSLIPSNICQKLPFNRITWNSLNFYFFKYIFNASCVPRRCNNLWIKFPQNKSSLEVLTNIFMLFQQIFMGFSRKHIVWIPYSCYIDTSKI